MFVVRARWLVFSIFFIADYYYLANAQRATYVFTTAIFLVQTACPLVFDMPIRKLDIVSGLLHDFRGTKVMLKAALLYLLAQALLPLSCLGIVLALHDRRTIMSRKPIYVDMALPLFKMASKSVTYSLMEADKISYNIWRVIRRLRLIR